MEFEHLKPFVTPNGEIITWKAKLTIHGVVYAECYENKNRYLLSDLQETDNLPEDDDIDNEDDIDDPVSTPRGAPPENTVKPALQFRELSL